jgi:hypothetical protein
MKHNFSDADYAITLRPSETENLEFLESSSFLWSGWKRHHWPADIIRPGLRIYGFDMVSRRFCVLLEVTRGGSFTYRTRWEFANRVLKLTSWEPDHNDPHWPMIPVAETGKHCTGVAFRWRVIKPVSISWPYRFSQLGWKRLASSTRIPDIDPLEGFAEGDKRLRVHLATERNSALRARAKDYWQTRLGALRCLICNFSFEDTYHDFGAGFIEMHHDVSLSLNGKRVNRVIDLKPVCANCHRMIHRDPFHPLSMTKLKNQLKIKSRNKVG